MFGVVLLLGGLGAGAWFGFERFGGGTGGEGAFPVGLIAGIVAAILGFALVRGGSVVSISIGRESLMSVETLDPALVKDLAEMMAHGRKIDAVKACREATGMGLAESKACVEKIAELDAASRHAA